MAAPEDLPALIAFRFEKGMEPIDVSLLFCDMAVTIQRGTGKPIEEIVQGMIEALGFVAQSVTPTIQGFEFFTQHIADEWNRFRADTIKRAQSNEEPDRLAKGRRFYRMRYPR